MHPSLELRRPKLASRQFDRQAMAIARMRDFASRTGLTTQGSERRYLWTDAYAVQNYVGLARATGDAHYDELALLLIDRVHRSLGRYRDGEGRSGWLSGLEGPFAEEHPTLGGLRIGKPLPERSPGESANEDLEWDRDGQYFHYITQWIHALDQVARTTGRATFNRWGRELMQTAHRAFVYQPINGGQKRMFWKMSTDLSRPLVASMGHHDPLDGFITCVELDATARLLQAPLDPALDDARGDFESMVDLEGLATADPLGIGGLLVDACRLEQLAREGADIPSDLIAALLDAGFHGIRHYLDRPDMRLPAEYRLAFRELGFAIGLAAVERIGERIRSHGGFRGSPSVPLYVERLEKRTGLRNEIETFWLDPQNRRTRSWLEHADINDVMLATTLAPEGFLRILQ